MEVSRSCSDVIGRQTSHHVQAKDEAAAKRLFPRSKRVSKLLRRTCLLSNHNLTLLAVSTFSAAHQSFTRHHFWSSNSQSTPTLTTDELRTGSSFTQINHSLTLSPSQLTRCLPKRI